MQPHRPEFDARKRILQLLPDAFPAWGGRLGDDHLLDLGLLGEISETALTREMEFEVKESELPNTFVPGRNLVFLTVAAAVAYRRGIEVLVGGMCETDFSGYPDCRDDTRRPACVGTRLRPLSRMRPAQARLRSLARRRLTRRRPRR